MAVEGGGESLSELYSQARRLSLKVKDGLERLERFEYTSASSSSLSSSRVLGSGSTDDQATAIRRDISEILNLCSVMDNLWRSIPSKPTRDLWKRKVEHIGEEAESFRGSLDKYQMRQQQRVQQVLEREELLGRANGDPHILKVFDEEAQAMASVRNSSRLLEDTLSTGIAILSNYSSQRDRLKNAQRKALDVLNTLGLSSSILRLIERRNRVDKWIKYGGMALTMIIVIIFWRWTR